MKLPVAPSPVGDYQAVVIRQNFGCVSGQFPIMDNRLAFQGKIGEQLNLEQAKQAMQVTALNVLSHIAHATDDFKQLDGLLRLEGHLVCSEGFMDEVKVLNQASKVFNRHLKKKGEHTRALFIHNKLPLDSPIELLVSFLVK